MGAREGNNVIVYSRIVSFDKLYTPIGSSIEIAVCYKRSLVFSYIDACPTVSYSGAAIYLNTVCNAVGFKLIAENEAV